ncbi:RmlC-like cupin domain-containing protein [Syncephalastrum racemosum]|uniref:RmlC-like cupin domain-containing protein n=1 Tax=Syncephalastrum racemosum TaxID=13706 RepID=A0A1X2HI35_SYNRA|nr:RmlC-like cupin domain-containing protein [Syncephalastrum racemosum]
MGNDLDFLQKYPGIEAEPLWTVMSAMVPPKPSPKAVPHIWEYQKIRPALIESGERIGAEEAERRVLMLINPNLKAPQTTDTLYAGLQLINPGETAPAHRHRAFALRFIIEGERGFTAVEGEKLYMDRGDVILTPPWCWHDHGHEGEDVMIWLDGLDLPMFQHIPVNFAENYAESRYPSIPVENSPIKFPWAPVQKALNNTGDTSYAVYEYRREDGSPLSKIIGAQAERIGPGASSPMVRETSSKVAHIYDGKGFTEITESNGNTKTLNWTRGDTMSIPSWAAVVHHAEGDQPAYIFSFNDKPLLDNLALYKNE